MSPHPRETPLNLLRHGAAGMWREGSRSQISPKFRCSSLLNISSSVKMYSTKSKKNLTCDFDSYLLGWHDFISSHRTKISLLLKLQLDPMLLLYLSTLTAFEFGLMRRAVLIESANGSSNILLHFPTCRTVHLRSLIFCHVLITCYSQAI